MAFTLFESIRFRWIYCCKSTRGHWQRAPRRDNALINLGRLELHVLELEDSNGVADLVGSNEERLAGWRILRWDNVTRLGASVLLIRVDVRLRFKECGRQEMTQLRHKHSEYHPSSFAMGKGSCAMQQNRGDFWLSHILPKSPAQPSIPSLSPSHEVMFNNEQCTMRSKSWESRVYHYNSVQSVPLFRPSWVSGDYRILNIRLCNVKRGGCNIVVLTAFERARHRPLAV